MARRIRAATRIDCSQRLGMAMRGVCLLVCVREYVCICLCMCVCVCVCVCVYLYINSVCIEGPKVTEYVYMRACALARVCVCVCACVSVYTI